MPANTSPDNITYPIASDPIAPLNAVFQSMATSTQSALTANANNGYRLRQIVQFTTTGTFTKASYPWLRAIRVRCVGGGGGGGGAIATAAGQYSLGGGGGGGGYSEKFTTDIAGLASSVTVTVGAGGTAGSGSTAGGTGGTSSFGTQTATGGTGGFAFSVSTATGLAVAGRGEGGSGSNADLILPGSDGGIGAYTAVVGPLVAGNGGASVLGGARTDAIGGSGSGLSGRLYGGGAVGAKNEASQAARAGSAGGAGIVIVELFA